MAVSLLTESTLGAYGFHFNDEFSFSTSSACEIEEEEEEELECAELLEINHWYPPMETITRWYPPMESIKEENESSLFSLDHDCVYVAVGKNTESSMDALSWTLNHAVNPTTIVYLVHVFAETKYIPSPLGMGMIPKSQVNPQVLKKYMAQERCKRREFLQKFLDACSASKVEVDTMLIESDMVTKSILDLIPILNIRKLVLGITKSNLRKSKSRRGSGIADQILHGAPETCDVKIVCQGKEVFDQMIESSPPSPSPRGSSLSSKAWLEEDQINDSSSWMCFKS